MSFYVPIADGATTQGAALTVEQAADRLALALRRGAGKVDARMVERSSGPQRYMTEGETRALADAIARRM